MDEGRVKYLRECVRIAEVRLKSAKEAAQWGQERVRIFELGLAVSKRRLRLAQEAGEEAPARTDDGRPINDIGDS